MPPTSIPATAPPEPRPVPSGRSTPGAAPLQSQVALTRRAQEPPRRLVLRLSYAPAMASDHTATRAEPPYPPGGVGPFSFSRPPRLVFHLLLVLATVPLIFAASSPAGGWFLWALGSGLFLAAAGVFWMVWVGLWFAARRRGFAVGSARWFVVAPVTGVLLLVFLALDIPLQLRWSQAQPAFDRLVKEAATPDGVEPVELETPSRLGTYAIDRAESLDGQTFVFLDTSSSPRPFLTSAGFAHLPAGPRHDYPVLCVVGGERVEYRHLTGPWYTFAAYW